MSDDQFTKLFKYMQVEFKAVRQEIAGVDQSVSQLRGDIEGFAKQALDLNQEFLMLSHKVDRLEGLIQQVAQKAGVKIDY